MKNIALLSCALALALTACKKDKKDDKATDTPATDTPPAETTTAEKPTEPTTPPPAEVTPPAEPAKPEKPASVTDEQVKLADDFVAAIEATAAAVEGAKGDCKVMAKSLTAEGNKMKALIGKLEAMKKANEKDDAARDWFKATYETKVMEQFGKIMTGVTPCKDDKAVQAALKSIGPKKTKEPSSPGESTEPTVK